MNSIYLPLLNVLDRAPWTEGSLCALSKDRDAWFPARRPNAHDPAVLTCQMCPVIGQCAAEALAAGEAWGVRAGIYLDSMRPAQRRAVLTDIALKYGVAVPGGVDPDHVVQDPNVGSYARTVRTHCSQGHEFTKENTGQSGHGARYCKTCQARSNKKRRAERRAAGAES